MTLRARLALVLALAVPGSGCGDPSSQESRAAPVECTALRPDGGPRARHLLLVVADTLRADRLGAYGGKARTPAFDALAAAGHLFTAAQTQAPWTLPAIATLFTGLYPSQHGVLSHPELHEERHAAGVAYALPPEVSTFAEASSAAGYQTAAFVSNPWLGKKLGFAQGFDHYEQASSKQRRPGHRIAQAVLRWLALQASADRSWLVYVHFMDPHEPYTPIPPAALEERRAEIETDSRSTSEHARWAIGELAVDPAGTSHVDRGVAPSLALLELLYDQGVERFDRNLATLLDGVRRHVDEGDLAIIATSDHGESLYHRGFRGHGHSLYEDETAIPLAMSLPGVSGPRRIGCPVGLIDVRATLCRYLDLDCGDGDQGRSLLSETGAIPTRAIVTEGVIAKPRHRAARDERYKLVWQPDGAPARQVDPPAHPYALYDLVQDPGESHDLLAGSAPGGRIAAAFDALRLALETAVPGDGVEPTSTTLDPATRAQLEALGYFDE